METAGPRVGTLPALFQITASGFGAQPALRARKNGAWRTVTYDGYAGYVRDLSCFLLSEGVRAGDRAVVVGPNSPEWAIADFAVLHAGAITVPLYETLGRDKTEAILEDAQPRVAFALTEAHANRLRRISPQSLERVVTLDSGSAADDRLLPWTQALARGASYAREHPPAFQERWRSVRPEELASLVYTSGTTGAPKGVELSHANFVSNVQAATSVVPVGPNDTVLSFLPLAHVLERMAGHFAIAYAGGTIAYAESVDTVARDLLEVRPTIVIGVPRLFEKMEARIQSAARERGTERILARAIEAGRDYVRRRMLGLAVPLGLSLRYRVFDRLVLAKIRARTGGNLRFFVCGGAHIRQDLEELFSAAGLPVLGGYGLTETSPVVSVNTLPNHRFGSVGRPIPGVEVRIAEDGEIFVQGPNVMRGYRNLPRDTEEAFLVDPQTGARWLATGDIGRLDADGFLYVTDRKKELIVLSNGKKIAPQPIEEALCSQAVVSQAIVVGTDRPYAVALLVPDFDAVSAAAPGGTSRGAASELVRDPRVVALVAETVENQNRKLGRFETIKAFTLLDSEFTEERGELTPTRKLRRKVIEERYARQIERLYSGSG